MNQQMVNKALHGVKVLEWGQSVAAPYSAKLLADLGAEVVKVEPPGRGDEARSRGPFLNDLPHPERSGLFLYLNSNKLGITLNVEASQGKKIFQELIEGVDILIEDRPPTVMEELGLNYENIKSRYPRLIMASITPFGQTGPYRDYKAYPLNTFHSGGEGYMTPAGGATGVGPMDRPPVKSGKYVGEYSSGIVAAVAILYALFARRATGLGQHIDASKQEALISLASMELQDYPHYGVVTNRATQVSDLGGRYQCKDGFIMFYPVGTWKEDWATFYQALAYPEVDEKLNDPEYVLEHRKELASVRTEWLAKRGKEEIFSSPPARQIVLLPVYRLDEVVNHPQITSRGFFVECEHPEVGRLKYPSAPYRLSETPWRMECPAPLLGQHNEEIYHQRLGYTKEDLVKLRESGVI